MIPYGDIEEELSAYTAISMIRKSMFGTLVPTRDGLVFDQFQHHRDVLIWWSNLSFDQAKQLFDNLQISDGQLLLITKKENDDIPCPKLDTFNIQIEHTERETPCSTNEATIDTTTTSIQSRAYPLRGFMLYRASIYFVDFYSIV